MNEFEYDAQGNLRHYINGELRAIVPPAGLNDYHDVYPDVPVPPWAEASTETEPEAAPATEPEVRPTTDQGESHE